MNDEAALIAAIAAAPDDRHLPLVFADWLDDRGDPRGAWIRHPAVSLWMPPNYENPIPKLLAALAADKRVIDVRRAAEVIGEPIVPGLIELLRHEKPRVRRQACMCLRNIGKRAKEAVPALLDVLGDPERDVREQAAKALKDIGATGITDTDQLKAALTDDDWSVRHAASQVLGSMRAKGSVLQEFVEQLDSPDPDDRQEAIRGLMQLDTADAVPAFDRALDDPEVAVREVAVQALGRLKFADASGALCRAMKDRVATIRKSAARQLGSGGRYAALTPEVVAALVALLDDPVPDVRAAACTTIARFDSPLVPPLIPRVVALLDDLSTEVQQSAISALGSIARGNKAALKALTAQLSNLDPKHRQLAVNAIGIVGRNDSGALTALTPLFSDLVEEVAYEATSAIGNWEKLPASVAAPLLERLSRLRDADQQVHAIAGVLVALGRFEEPPAGVIEALREAVRNPPVGYGQLSAIEALAALGPAAVPAIPDLVALFTRDDPPVNYYAHSFAVTALVRVGERGRDQLVALLDTESDDTRTIILQGLRDQGSAALPFLPAVLRLYHRTTDERHQALIVELIRALGPEANAAIPDLLAALETTQSRHTRTNTLRALQQFGTAFRPHLPQLIEFARRPEFVNDLDTIATIVSHFAPREPQVKDPLREFLRAAAPDETDDSAQRRVKKFTRQICASALFALNDATLLPELARLVDDPEPDIRVAIAYELNRLDTPAVLPLLRRLLGDSTETVRLRAIEVLVRRNDTSAETSAALVHAVEAHAVKVRRAAIDALGKLNVSTDAVLAALSTATSDSDKKVAERAAIVLRKLAPKAPKPAPARAKKPPAPTNPKGGLRQPKEKKKPQ